MSLIGYSTRIFKPVLFVAFLFPISSFAGSFYFDVGAGLGQFRLADPFFPGAPLKTQYDVSYAGSLVANFGSGAVIESQAGLMYRCINGKDPGLQQTYTVTSLYPFYRLQFTKMYFSMGLTPFVFKESNSVAKTRVHGIASLLEIGMLFPFTPKFSMNFAAAVELVSEGGIIAPKPIFSGILSFRFYFGQFGSNGNMVSSNEFKGWRYPLGGELR